MNAIAREAYTIEEASQAYPVSPTFLRKAIAKGELAVKLIGAPSNGKRIISVEALREWYKNLPDG